MKKVAVIGAGAFGASAALELSKNFEVFLFERQSGILSGASTNNHLRHHYGYHYPRSAETALESIKARESFERHYGKCILENVKAYYAVSKKDSKTTPKDFLKFCDNLKLPYEIAWPGENIFDKSKMEICVKVPEPAYDPDVLREIIFDKIKNSGIKLMLNYDLIEGKIASDKKILKFRNENKIIEKNFDYVVCALYSNFNQVNKWFGLPKKKVEYALMELIDIELPIKERIAFTIVDGDFATFIPTINKGIFRLGHVKESVLKEMISDDLDTDLIASENTLSNKEKILKESLIYYPILKEAKFVKSVFVTRVVKANVENTDERPTEITYHENGIYSIFGGKVITCVEAAKKLAKIIAS